MARKIYVLLLLSLLSSCVVKKKTTYGKKRSVTVAASEEKPEAEPAISVTELPKSLGKADRIINSALSYSGVRYKYGGTSRKGMDCSGLLYVSFAAHDVALPRVSYDMANEGKKIKLNKVAKGDLLFFKTKRRGKKINHVGLVVSVDDDDIRFIHSTSSRGVIVSSLREGFWNLAFVKATRVL